MANNPTYSKSLLCNGVLSNDGTTITYTYQDENSEQQTKIINVAKCLEKFYNEKIILTISVDTSGEDFTEDEEENE